MKSISRSASLIVARPVGAGLCGHRRGHDGPGSHWHCSIGAVGAVLASFPSESAVRLHACGAFPCNLFLPEHKDGRAVYWLYVPQSRYAGHRNFPPGRHARANAGREVFLRLSPTPWPQCRSIRLITPGHGTRRGDFEEVI